MLYNDDCLNIFKQMEAESIDLVVTDCPYHIVSGGCSNDAVKIGRYAEETGTKDQFRKDDHGNTFFTNSNHVTLCGILSDVSASFIPKKERFLSTTILSFQTGFLKYTEFLKTVHIVT